tara:strand:+ start:107 stop:490 length:384 start_codon:yes stop_codon:yes gene_type:complete
MSSHMDEPYFIAKLKEHLPLPIEYAACQDGFLVVSGSQWSFTANSSWRVSSVQGFEYGSDDGPARGQEQELSGARVTEVRASGFRLLDVILILSNGLAIESFSATHFEPWELRLPDGTIMVADGSAA